MVRYPGCLVHGVFYSIVLDRCQPDDKPIMKLMIYFLGWEYFERELPWDPGTYHDIPRGIARHPKTPEVTALDLAMSHEMPC